MTEDPNLMDLQEFIDEGYLQEINRRVLHPAGLALVMFKPIEGDRTYVEVWDYRSDPEGMLFGPGEISEDKVERVQREIERHNAVRTCLTGSSNIQFADSPIPLREHLFGSLLEKFNSQDDIDHITRHDDGTLVAHHAPGCNIKHTDAGGCKRNEDG